MMHENECTQPRRVIVESLNVAEGHKALNYSHSKSSLLQIAIGRNNLVRAPILQETKELHEDTKQTYPKIFGMPQHPFLNVRELGVGMHLQ